MTRLLYILPLLAGVALSTSCTQESSLDCEADNDGDGILNCDEVDLGTNPDNADSDGDGFADDVELDCVSDPTDGDEGCYACGWEHNDPHTLVSTGSGIGDVMDNVQLQDRCGEMVNLWDFHGEYHVLYRTAAW